MKNRLMEYRKRAGFKSSKEFAEHIGMSYSRYRKYESGERGMDLEQAWEFADILGCSIDDLAGRS